MIFGKNLLNASNQVQFFNGLFCDFVMRFRSTNMLPRIVLFGSGMPGHAYSADCLINEFTCLVKIDVGRTAYKSSSHGQMLCIALISVCPCFVHMFCIHRVLMHIFYGHRQHRVCT